MRTVNDVLERKGKDIWYVRPNSSIAEALQLMAEKNIGAVLVVEQGNLVGILSERDYVRKAVSHEALSETTPVADLMTRDVYTLTPADKLDECMTLMASTRARHIPVLDEGVLVGVVSIGDVVNDIIDEHRFTIRELEKYIRGEY